MPDIWLRLTGQKRRHVGPQSYPEASATRQNGPPSRISVAEQSPNKAPEKIDRHDVAKRDGDALQRDLSLSGKAQRISIENYKASGDKPNHANRIDPMKPTRRRVPHQIRVVFGLRGKVP